MAPDILRLSAFSGDPAGGNPAGIVLDARGLDDAAMLALAAEVGYSETAFLTPDAADDRAFAVRYFSPAVEVPFCGHATVATAVALAERIGPGDLVLSTRAGTVPVSVTADDTGRLSATLTSVEPAVEDIADSDVAEALAALDWPATDLDPALPPRIASAGARHLVLAAATRSRLAHLDYDFPRLTTFMTTHALTTLQLVWRESPDVFHVRNPFPIGGVVEDPATGAAAAALGAYLRDRGEITPPAQITLHQGHDLGRPSLLVVEVSATDPRIKVTGTAVPLP
jgi:PhzF family phenazine biosynthesis protein